MHDSFISAIKKIGPFSKEDIVALTEKLNEVHLTKGECLLKEGEICQSFYFLEKGCLRQFYWDMNGNETVLNLFVENNWVIDQASLTGQKPSKNNIEACEDSLLFSLSIYDVHKLIALSPTFLTLGRIFETSIQNPLYTNSKVSPEEKYTHLLQTRPELLQKFQLKHIASFLGMTPETLSRVRRKLIQ